MESSLTLVYEAGDSLPPWKVFEDASLWEYDSIYAVSMQTNLFSLVWLLGYLVHFQKLGI